MRVSNRYLQLRAEDNNKKERRLIMAELVATGKTTLPGEEVIIAK